MATGGEFTQNACLWKSEKPSTLAQSRVDKSFTSTYGCAHFRRGISNSMFEQCKHSAATISALLVELHRRASSTHLWMWSVIFCVALSGCSSFTIGPLRETIGNRTAEIDSVTAALAKIDVSEPPAHADVPPVTNRQLQLDGSTTYRNMTLSEALAIAANNGDVIRELGGAILRNPEQTRTIHNAQLQYTDPRYSVHAALSAFDAQLQSSAEFNNNDRTFNNPFFAGGINAFRQDQHAYKTELYKRTATGAFLAVRNLTDYDANNAPGNIFASAWDTYFEGEVRQPLLQGAGLQFNRIAGPGSVAGVYNGVMIARVNTEVSQTDFEMSVRDYLSNVVNAYWDLYYAYRDLDARRRSLDRVRELWQRQKARTQADAEMESGSKEALVRANYFRMQGEVNDALAGRLVQGTQNRNGSPAGTFRGTPGVNAAERRLRLLIGMPINDTTLIRTVEEPEMAEYAFDWQAVLTESLMKRPEIRRQHLRVKRREMELLAARNYRNPRLDAFGRYRFRGFGHTLLADGNNGGTSPESALGNVGTGDLQEWTLGMELSIPIGFRVAHAAVSNAEIALARERAVQREQKRQIVHDLSNAISDAQRAFAACDIQLNRYLAEREILRSLEAQEENELPVEVDRILDSHRRLSESEIAYFRARSEYAVALKNVHYVKGTMMSGFEMGFQRSEENNPYESGMESTTLYQTPPTADLAIEFRNAPASQNTPGPELPLPQHFPEPNHSGQLNQDIPGFELPLPVPPPAQSGSANNTKPGFPPQEFPVTVSPRVRESAPAQRPQTSSAAQPATASSARGWTAPSAKSRYPSGANTRDRVQILPAPANRATSRQERVDVPLIR